MEPLALRIICEEHFSIAAVLRSLRMMLKRGPEDDAPAFFDAMRAMLFYIDEVPEQDHHPKESRFLFAPLLERAPEHVPLLERLEREHVNGERTVRELQHQLLAWELMGEGRRAAFTQALNSYITFYLEHMRLEETLILPAAIKVLTAQDWARIDEAFMANQDPLAGDADRSPEHERLFQRIVHCTPSPIGLRQELAAAR
ncbi:hemerythrin domain-containing protein [Comamonas sp. NLF-1-9]|uniref:hemerythrin domain-containing protein n=1 Tax=Comamonas sp. NLF-1-9 TaxID=2853163 RepID=UPI001C490BEF|nr:hemerythrin domain-containing protein [Comamonas sp. NLF-1-9]QXL83641.1 hemerythrin domain-containing protein [Comamonas sp. NLF-1-9]